MTTKQLLPPVDLGYSRTQARNLQIWYDKWFDKPEQRSLIQNLFVSTNGADSVPWGPLVPRHVEIKNREGEVIYEKDCRFPQSWSDNACRIVASKYFTPEEIDLSVMVDRVVNTIDRWGKKDGYLTETSREFSNELKSLLYGQAASFNSPVYFNVGVRDEPQCSACFINSVEDNMESILDLAKTEALVFKEGSGSGVNLTTLRSSLEPVSGGGTASGPVSFMQMLDANAGVIKSGGRTRRSATMRILDMGHDDIATFIRSKGIEEAKAQALIAQGYDGSLNGEAYSSVFFQNANHSVRITDDEMAKGQVEGSHENRMLRMMSEEAWRCGDPGVQFADAINQWHTCKADGDIVASNPCSEYLFLNDTACNLASINVMAFATRAKGRVVGIDLEGFRQAVRVMITAMDIIVDNSHYPTEELARRTKIYRTLGLGITNLGAFLMARGYAYDSIVGRNAAKEIVSIMAAEAHLQSIRIASKLGPYTGWEDNRNAHLGVIHRHVVEAEKRGQSASLWQRALELADRYGMRNAQLTVIAPTGTISFLMDCESTGIEPLISLSANKSLSGGGELEVSAQACVEDGLRQFGYSKIDHPNLAHAAKSARKGIRSVKGLSDTHHEVFETALGTNGQGIVSPEGQIDMMAAIQPFICGGISKTVNLPAKVEPEHIRDVYRYAHERGIKSIAVYRDGSKLSQPIQANTKIDAAKVGVGPVVATEEVELEVLRSRERLPDTREGVIHHFRLGGSDGYVMVGLYEDGRPGEVFIKVAKQGSALSGLLDAIGIAVSIGLQHGVPLSLFVSKFKGMSFDPSGWANGKHHPSLMSYIFDWMGQNYVHEGAGDFVGRLKKTIDTFKNPQWADAAKTAPSLEFRIDPAGNRYPPSATMCPECGAVSAQTGTCFSCKNCGYDSGC